MSPDARDRSERIAALRYAYAEQPMQARERCNLCGHDRFVTVAHRDRYGFPARARGCLRCGLVFLDPALTPDAYAKFYRDVYRPLVSAYHGRRIDAGTIQQEQRDYAHGLADLLAPWLERRGGTSLLDVGGSTGVVAHHLKERFDLAATVIDPAPLEIERARQLGLRTVSGFVEDFEAGSETFDLVVMCQTVDHLHDVAGTLRKIRALLSDGGLFFVDIVDFRAAYRRHGSVEEAVKIDHPYSLTQATIEAYLRRAGFETLAIDYEEDHLHVGYLCEPGRADPEARVPAADVAAQWRELRDVQNPLPAAPAPEAKR